MSKGLFIFVTLLAGMMSAVAQPRVKWLEQVHNYGAFDENDGKVTCTMRFVNVGTRPLSVLAARATCGCATPEFTKTPVEPGDTGSVRITYNPTGRPGRFSKKVFIDMNTIPARSTLEVKGVVVGASNTVRSRFPVDAGPLKMRTSVAAFGQVVKGHNKTAYIDVYNTTADSIFPQWTNVPEYIHISTGVTGIAPGDYGSFTFYLDSSKCPDYGVVTDEMTLIPDAVAADEGVKVSTVAIINEDFSMMSDRQRDDAPVISVIPENIDFDVINVGGGKVTKSATVKNHGKSTMIIRRVYTSDKGVEVSIGADKIKKGKSAELKVTVDPKAIAGNTVDSKVLIITNSPDNPTKSVRITGILK